MSFIWGTAKWYGGKAWQTGAYYFGSKTNLPSLSSRVDALAQKGLDNATKLGLNTESTAGNLQTNLDRHLVERERARVVKLPIAMGQIAQIPNVPIDPKTTMALPLQMQIELTDWRRKTQENQAEFSKKLTAYLTFIELRDRSGMTGVDNIELMRLVQNATLDGEKRSLWKIFTT